jgi:hypothetical protein
MALVSKCTSRYVANFAGSTPAKFYWQITLPLDSVTPGSTIPLFPGSSVVVHEFHGADLWAEESVKILSSQVHPLDHNSVPYDFSSDLCPLLHHAARALNREL